MAKLVLFLENGTTRDIVLNKDHLTLGRRADNDICLPDPAVSGEHAAVVTILTDSFLEDLDSTNGTVVNGKPVQRHFLCDGDVIDLGRQRLVYLVDDLAQPNALVRPDARHSFPGETMHNGGPPTTPTHLDPPPPRSERSSPAPRESGRSHIAGTATVSERAASGTLGVAMVDTPPMQPRAAAPDLEIGEAPQLIVLTGPSAGRTLALTKEVTSVGRAGVQVALVRRTPRGYVVSSSEGSRPPLLNGVAIQLGGSVLEAGDVIEIAGARIEFSTGPDLPT